VSGGALIGALGMWQGTGHPINPAVYWIVSILALFVALFLAWNDQRLEKEKAIRENEQLKGKRDWYQAWLQCAEKFKPFGHARVSARWHHHGHSHEEGWELFPSDNSDSRHLQSLCLLAGQSLLVSPAVSLAVAKTVKPSTTPINLWLDFLRVLGETRSADRYQVEIKGEFYVIENETISNLAEAAERACIECATIELGNPNGASK
jgi:hypothetical protein